LDTFSNKKKPENLEAAEFRVMAPEKIKISLEHLCYRKYLEMLICIKYDIMPGNHG
jgi:hypothetical protein